ncbi:hypothetical protein M0804_011685 [Polistes exclamans]|nr:hypothetical protein M0804_011685 [Polistes exclamans]
MDGLHKFPSGHDDPREEKEEEEEEEEEGEEKDEEDEEEEEEEEEEENTVRTASTPVPVPLPILSKPTVKELTLAIIMAGTSANTKGRRTKGVRKIELFSRIRSFLLAELGLCQACVRALFYSTKQHTQTPGLRISIDMYTQ